MKSEGARGAGGMMLESVAAFIPLMNGEARPTCSGFLSALALGVDGWLWHAYQRWPARFFRRYPDRF